MTKIVQVKVVDNFNQHVPAEKSLVFVFDGIAYGMDLCAANYLLAVRDFGKYTSVAQRLGPATVTAETKDGPEVVVKPRGKTAKQPATRTAPKRAQAKQPPPKQPSPLRPHQQRPASIAVAPNGQIPLPKFHEAQAPSTNGHVKQLKDDGLPPDKSWLRQTDRERSGPGSREMSEKGAAYRMAMRVWLRSNGWPELGNRGIVPSDAIDQYWAHVVEVRATVAEPT